MRNVALALVRVPTSRCHKIEPVPELFGMLAALRISTRGMPSLLPELASSAGIWSNRLCPGRGIWARQVLATAFAAIAHFVSGFGFFDIQQRDDLIEPGIAHHVEPDKLHGPLARTLAGEKLQHQRGDERALDLDGHAFGRFGHEVTAAEDAFFVDDGSGGGHGPRKTRQI